MHNAAFASAAALFSRLLLQWRGKNKIENKIEIEHQGRVLLSQWEFLVLQLPDPVARSASVRWVERSLRFARAGRSDKAGACMNRAMGYFRS
jgi:hypothetical protein